LEMKRDGKAQQREHKGEDDIQGAQMWGKFGGWLIKEESGRRVKIGPQPEIVGERIY